MIERVLLIGGSGFTGSRVASRLARLKTFGLARSATAAASLSARGITPVVGDLDDPRSIDDAFREVKPQALICVASLGFGHAPGLVAAAEDAGVRRAVFISTTAVTTTLQPASKAVRLAAEAAIERSALDWTIIRPTMIYGGPDDRNMARLLRLLRRAPVMVVPGDGLCLQQPVHVEDLADAIVVALRCPAASRRRLDLAGPTAHSFRQIIGLAGNAVGRTPRVVSLPLGPAVLALKAYERITKDPWLKAEQVLRLDEDKCFSIAEAQAVLGFAPRSFATGIEQEAKDLFAR